MESGKLIAFEGLDKSGKSTQAEMLSSYFRSKNISHKVVRFPCRTIETGKILDRYLKGQLPELENNIEATHLLFAANRWELVETIKQWLNEGIHVILDRYSISGIVYSISKKIHMRGCCTNTFRDWVQKSEIGLPKPSILFYIDIEPQESVRRTGSCVDGVEIYEHLEFQRIVAAEYKLMLPYDVFKVSGMLSPEDIHDTIISHVTSK